MPPSLDTKGGAPRRTPRAEAPPLRYHGPPTENPMLEPRDDASFMEEALAEARRAAAEGEVPVGAVVVREGKVVGRGHNQRERLNDPTAHAEMIALTQAAEAVGSWRLDGCAMVVTLEP